MGLREQGVHGHVHATGAFAKRIPKPASRVQNGAAQLDDESAIETLPPKQIDLQSQYPPSGTIS